MAEKQSIPALYLMSAVFSNKKRISQLEPVANALIIAEPTEGESKVKTQPLGTNTKGQLVTLKKKGSNALNASNLAHDINVQLTFIPPADAVSFIAASEGEKWADSLVEAAKSIKATKIPLKLTDIPYSDIRKPSPSRSPNAEEADYQKWYMSLPPNKPLKGYILAKTKALIIVVKADLDINFGNPIIITPPIGEPLRGIWRPDDFSGYRYAVITGDKTPLSEGLHKIDITLTGAAKNNPKWHSLVSGDKGKLSYSLAEMVRFDIKTAAGDLDILCCDPISLEETLLTQYGRFYSHRLEQATNLSANTAAVGTAAQDAGKGIADYAKSLDVWKNKSELAAGLSQHDLNDADGRKDLRKGIVKALHDHMATDPQVKATLDSVFALDNGVSAWKDLLDAREKALNATSGSTKTALLNKYIKFKPATIEDMEAFQGSLAHKAGIPMKGLQYFGRTMQTIDLANNVAALTKGGVALFTDTLPNASKAITDFNAVAEDYFFHLSEHEVQPVLTLTNQFELDSFELSETTKSELKGIVQTLIKNTADDANRRITITGHTCDLGGYEYNLQLSIDRAQAVEKELINLGVPASRLNANGLGESQPLLDAPNTNDANRRRNRRVEIVDFSIGVSGVYPSREGMGNLERFRNMSVQGQLKVVDEALAVTNKAVDLALGVMAVIPATAPVAAAVALAKAGSDVLVSLCALADQTFCNNFFKQLAQEANLNRTFARESSANQNLLEKLGKQALENKKPQNADLWAAQFRMRSEAIAGLIRLIIRAEIGADNQEDYISRIQKYHLDAYINNFIMGDDWLYPLNNLQTVRMDSYWLFAISNFKRGENEKGLNNGLDENNKFLSAEAHKKIKKTAIDRLKRGEPDLPAGYAPSTNGNYMMMPALGRSPSNHLTAQYQSYFPVHFCSNDAESLAETFCITHSQYSTGDYLFANIKYKDGDNWKPFVTENQYQKIESERDSFKVYLPTTQYGAMAAYSAMPSKADIPIKTISPYTGIRVLVVFDKTNDILPVTFSIERKDGIDVSGPNYKELATPLNKDDLLPDEQQYAGKIGCIFYPFYQIWDKNIQGLKPIASDWTLGMMSADMYYLFNNLEDMEYQVKCRIGSNFNTEQIIPLLSSRRIGGGFSSDSLDTIKVSVDKKRPGEQALIDRDFLISRTSSFEYPKLYDGETTVRALVRIGSTSPYIMPGQIKAKNGKSVSIFEDEAKHFSCTKFDITTDGISVRVNNFDWGAPVEFTTVVSASEINTKPYLKEGSKSQTDFASSAADWRSLPCDLTLYEEDFFEKENGPSYQSRLIFLGKLTLTTKKTFDIRGTYTHRNVSFDTHNTDATQTAKFEGLIELFKQSSTKALEMIDLQDYTGDSPRVRYIFAASIQCSYESPKARKVNSIRPFNNEIYTEKSEYMKINLSLSTAGQSGFKDHVIEKNSYNYKFQFSTPLNFLKDVPWAQPLDKSVLEELKPKLRDEVFNNLSSNELTKKDLTDWLNDGKSLKFSYTSAFKSMI